MSIKSTFLAVTALLAVADAHIKINSPVPFSKDTLDTAPITKSQYPCKANLGFKVSQMNQMAVGTSQKLSFDGTAVHGGGSCQLAITTDPVPSASSKFKVIKSIEGGCPGVEGTNSYDFTLPASIPNGKATFAWTWFAKLSGAPEMYMNCAPIEVTGGASDSTEFDALPDMFTANLDDTCKSPLNKATKFPNPGSELQMGSTNDAEPPTGSGCGASTGGGSAPAPSSPAGGSPAQPSSPAGQPATPPKSSPAAQPSQPAGGAPPVAAPSSAPTAPPSNPGGVFAPGASGAPTSTKTTLVTVTGAPTPAKSTAPAAPGTGTPAVPSSPAAAPPTTGGGSAGTCTTNGAVVCNGEKQFGLCNNGNVVWQDVASGTACVNGVISKRSPRPRYGNSRIVRVAA